MNENEVHSTMKPLAMKFIQELIEFYWKPLYEHVKLNPKLITKMPGFLLQHEKTILYIGRDHIAIEYMGPEFISELNDEMDIELQYQDLSIEKCNFFEEIIGFPYDSTLDITLPLPRFSEDLMLPTNRAWDKLSELGWNFSAQNSIMVMNTPVPEPVKGEFSRIVNGIFFDADDSGLKTRRIKWLDFFPIHFDDSDAEVDSFSFSLEKMRELVEPDANYSYPMPRDYKFVQLPKINKFIEMWGNKERTEPEITSFLSKPENEFILTMKFGASEVYSELTCEWQSEERDNIRPDFFIVQPNGYADIVEFKLPDIQNKVVVGRTNRETFGSWLNSYISQTRVYSSYFDDPNNRKWFERKYGFKVYKPKRWLVVGRRADFDSQTWREIMVDYRDLDILTFDDLIDGVVVQFYK